MLRLHQIFLYNFLAIFLLTFIFAGVISYFFLKSIEISQFTNHLQNSIVQAQLQLQETRSFDSFAKNIKSQTNLRVTIVDHLGVVIAESHYDKSNMDNHHLRQEIINANDQNFGVAIRKSSTLGEEFLYVAKKVHMGTQNLYVRMSISLKRILDDFYTIWIKITLIFALAVLVGFIVAYKISRRIQDDVTHLNAYLEQVDNKNYKAPLHTSFSYEFVNIAFTLKSVISKLDRREKQRRKYTAKLRLINKQRSDLLSALSHEFKNPLAAILGYAQTLQAEKTTPQNQSMHQRFLEKIVRNTQKITHMLDRLALSVKLENNDLTPTIELFDLSIIAQDAVHTLEKKYPNRTINFQPREQFVSMDKTMIDMVIINLLDNALKYSEDDVTLKVGKKRLSVSDHGLGMEPDELEKITSKFYRVDKNSWDNSMGLGLAIVSYILHLHHTKLQIKSEPKKGSTFSFKYIDE